MNYVSSPYFAPGRYILDLRIKPKKAPDLYHSGMKAQSIVLQHTLEQFLAEIEKISGEQFNDKPNSQK
jgi:RNA-binding protein YlmH